ncbi:Flp family type IVb pilin [Candidatus Binatus sp.]|uniref:Flp family type IVb pilin n=1 Tax=Candidatus Binatus sp. TaxID=2811406 RepID=UPI002F944FC5
MDALSKFIVRIREYQRGQTMAEYALILAAVAVVVFAGYELLGTNIKSALNSVDSQL